MHAVVSRRCRSCQGEDRCCRVEVVKVEGDRREAEAVAGAPPSLPCHRLLLRSERSFKVLGRVRLAPLS